MSPEPGAVSNPPNSWSADQLLQKVRTVDKNRLSLEAPVPYKRSATKLPFSCEQQRHSFHQGTGPERKR